MAHPVIAGVVLAYALRSMLSKCSCQPPNIARHYSPRDCADRYRRYSCVEEVGPFPAPLPRVLAERVPPVWPVLPAEPVPMWFWWFVAGIVVLLLSAPWWP